MIIVARCTQKATVPSTVIQCRICGNDCWLSKHSGENEIALAQQLGDATFVCINCVEQMLGDYVNANE